MAEATNNKSNFKSHPNDILLSRQALLFGEANSCEILANSAVLIINPNLLAVEIAKNLALAGVNKLFMVRLKLSDEHRNEHENWIETEEALKSMLSFNELVNQKIEWKEGVYDDFEIILAECNHIHNNRNDSDHEDKKRNKQHEENERVRVVILCDGNWNEERVYRCNETCREQNIKFLMTEVKGLVGYIFVDVGESYQYSVISENPEKKLIHSIEIIRSDVNCDNVDDNINDNSNNDDENKGGDNQLRLLVTLADKNHQFPLSSLVKFQNLSINDIIYNHNLPPRNIDDNNNSIISNENEDLVDKTKLCEYLMKNGPFTVDDDVSETQISILLPPNFINTFNINMEELKSKKNAQFLVRGSCEEVERIFQTSHRSLRNNLESNNNNHQIICKSPMYNLRNNKIIRSIITFFKTLSKYRRSHSRSPKTRSMEDFAAFISILQSEENDQPITDMIDDEFIKKLVFQSCGIVPAMVNIIGGIVSQEALKIIHASYRPIEQWFFFESIASLPPDYLTLPNDLFIPLPGEGYEYQIKVFGRDIQKIIEHRKVLLVGAGALGCEFLKLFALMGLATQGNIHVSDPDNINPSNLHRQFLFSLNDVSNSKSQIAARNITHFHSSIFNLNTQNHHHSHHKMNITNDQQEVSYRSMLTTHRLEELEEINEIFCAVDTQQAREIIDTICYFNSSIFLECGTRGNNCISQFYVPGYTPRYPVRKGEDQDFSCLGKDFPFRPRHTVMWALSLFTLLFSDCISTYNDIIAEYEDSDHHGDGSDDKQRKIKIRIEESLNDDEQSKKWLISLHQLRYYNAEQRRSYVQLDLFRRIFNDKIQHILDVHPPSSLDKNNEPYWTGIRVCPKKLPKMHLGDDKNNNNESDQEMIIERDNELDHLFAEYTSSTLTLLSELFDSQNNDSEYPLLTFNKDNERHINFIYAVGNLYSKMFSIPTLSKLKIQIIGGQITPAIITISSLCVGFVALEFYKLLHSHSSSPLNCDNDDHHNPNIDGESTRRIHQPVNATTLRNLRGFSYSSNANQFFSFPLKKKSSNYRLIYDNYHLSSSSSSPLSLLSYLPIADDGGGVRYDWKNSKEIDFKKLIYLYINYSDKVAIVHVVDRDITFSSLSEQIERFNNRNYASDEKNAAFGYIRITRISTRQVAGDKERIVYPIFKADPPIFQSLNRISKSLCTSSLCFKMDVENDAEEVTFDLLVKSVEINVSSEA